MTFEINTVYLWFSGGFALGLLFRSFFEYYRGGRG